jgi:hypothetical protein
MTIAAANVAYLQQGPVSSGQQLAPSMLEMLELSFLGTVTITGDAGASTTSVLNYIDGTNTLNFTPRAVLCFRTGGNATLNSVPYCVDNANAGLSATISYSVTPGSGLTMTIGVAILK